MKIRSFFYIIAIWIVTLCSKTDAAVFISSGTLQVRSSAVVFDYNPDNGDQGARDSDSDLIQLTTGTQQESVSVRSTASSNLGFASSSSSIEITSIGSGWNFRGSSSGYGYNSNSFSQGFTASIVFDLDAYTPFAFSINTLFTEFGDVRYDLTHVSSEGLRTSVSSRIARNRFTSINPVDGTGPITQNLDLTEGTLELTINGYDSYNSSVFNFDLYTVPEQGGMLLLGVAVGYLHLCRRRPAKKL